MSNGCNCVEGLQSACLSLLCHLVAVLLRYYRSRFRFYKTSFSSHFELHFYTNGERVGFSGRCPYFLLILVTLRPSSSNNNCRSGPGCHPPPSPPPNTPRCRKIEEATWPRLSAWAGLDCGGGRKLSDKLIKYEYLTSRLTLLTEVKRKHSQQKLDVRNILCKILKNLMSCYFIIEAPLSPRYSEIGLQRQLLKTNFQTQIYNKINSLYSIFCYF